MVANVVGLGLVGGSLAIALRERGFTVSGSDSDHERQRSALERSIIDSIGIREEAGVSFVCTPAAHAVGLVSELLTATAGVVTDVCSVKCPVVSAIRDPRFVGGHPMAGSELDGLDGADGGLFTGAVWVLTPSTHTADRAFTEVAAVVKSLGADVVTMSAERHDDLVAVVSHAPHLLAASLMAVAARRADDDSSLLRLAAGGFRDMTRIAAGNPRIWLDICSQNRSAIEDVLREIIEGLGRLLETVHDGDRVALETLLTTARRARVNLPARLPDDEPVHEIRIPIPDRPGSAAEVFTLAGELGVNIHDFEVVHSSEGNRGVVVLLVASSQVNLLRGGLIARGFRPGVLPLS